jgi:4-diphosphocytidyl-2-C-methyl-D-erythritol kinase
MSDTCHPLVVLAPAKVNLNLQVIGRRSDGYHELDTVMQKLDLSDVLTLRLRDRAGICLSCPGSALPEDSSNLVWQAAASFFKETGTAASFGIDLVLEKKIPIAAGLGGGSSDAAAVLVGLNRLLKNPLSEEHLLGMAKSLGADVPFFVVRSPAVRATGIGEKMSLWEPLRDCSLLLVNPGFSVSTAWVFKNFTLTRTDKDSNLSDSPKNRCPMGGSLPLYNDLESVTITQYPELDKIKQQMQEGGATGTLMSGSGATIFGVFPDHPDTALNVLDCEKKMKEIYGSGVFLTRPVSKFQSEKKIGYVGA